MHVLAISLLTILAGTLLLAKFRKDNPGKFFVYVSWFFIVVGFILFLGAIAGGICKISHRDCLGKPDCRQEMMMKKCDAPGQRNLNGPCCPLGMHKGMCPPGKGCMPNDSAAKCCPKHMMKCDSVKMQAPK
jgi:hypothetical protein